jgi:hypothetical protein
MARNAFVAARSCCGIEFREQVIQGNCHNKNFNMRGDYRSKSSTGSTRPCPTVRNLSRLAPGDVESSEPI